MNKLERWFLSQVFRKQVVQGPDHSKRITELYTMIRKAVENEFNEDNKPTRDEYLTEWFKESL